MSPLNIESLPKKTPEEISSKSLVYEVYQQIIPFSRVSKERHYNCCFVSPYSVHVIYRGGCECYVV